MKTYTGVSASSGVVVGPVERLDHGSTGLHRIVCDPYRERALYDVAVVLAKDELHRLAQHSHGADADILLFQIALLDDESFTNEIGDYIAAGASGAAAVERAEQIFAGRLRNVDDDYIRERSVDVCDVCRRIVDILDGRPRRPLRLTRPSILVADRFFPSDLFSLDHRMILGLASEQDSMTSHAAIMARSMDLPAVVQLGAGVAGLAVGHRALLDADLGCLTIEPTAATLAATEARARADRRETDRADPATLLPCKTKDGTEFCLLTAANFSGQNEVERGLQGGATGIGVLRTESSIAGDLTEEQQIRRYLELLDAADGAPLIVRLCDPSADDNAPWTALLRERLGARRTFAPQVRALLRTAAQAEGCRMRLLLPMIPDVDAWDEALAELGQCRAELLREGVQMPDLEIGCVIDMPSAALMAGDLLDHGASFLAIDIDDLTRYTCAVPADAPRSAYRVDAVPVQRLVQGVIEDVRARGSRLFIGGITVAEVDAMPAHLRLGVRAFCVEQAGLLPLKKLLMAQDLSRAED